MNGLNREDFWRWAYSDFLSNAQRGVLAEYIVGKALDCLKEKRLEWDAHDLQTDNGIKIEVKSAAYIQSWNQQKLSDIRFNIAKKQSWFAETNTTNAVRERSADMYVFCVLAETNRDKINPLDTDQWFLMVLPAETINKTFGNQKTIGLSTLERIGTIRIAFQELKAAIEGSAKRITGPT